MSTTTAIDWDQWRKAYPTLSYQDQKAFHELIWEQYPLQNCWHQHLLNRAIEKVQPYTVVELGGWDGAAAAVMLSQHPVIQRWTNVEICEPAAQHGQDRSKRYEAPILDGFYWEHGPWHADLFVASHSIEHLSAHHLERTIATTQAKAIYLDAPLEDEPTDWTGYVGSHILEIGWQGVYQILRDNNYWIKWSNVHEYGRACLFIHADHYETL